MTPPFVITVVFACTVLCVPAAGAEPNAELTRLEAAVVDYPGDPDLLWAFAVALARRRHLARAAEAFEAFEERWPQQRPDVALRLGNALFEAGRDAEAVDAFDRALELDPGSGVAHLYRGLALRRLGRTEESHRSLRMAAVLTPELAPEALLARALDHLGMGEDAQANQLLKETIDRDPDGQTAQRLLAEHGQLPIYRPFRSGLLALSAYGGVGYDSNVTLGSEDDALGLPAGESDFRFAWGSAVTLRPLRRERGGLRLDYHYDDSAHLDRTEYDLRGHSISASGLIRIAERFSFRLNGGAATYLRDGDQYLGTATIRPNVLVSLGDRIGVTRFFGGVTWLDYEEDPPFPSMERDAVVYGGGFEHYVSVSERFGLWGSILGRFARTDTHGGLDSLGFDSAYDHDRWEGRLRLHLPLIWKIVADGQFVVGYANYRHPNVFDFLFSLDADRRRDLYGEVGVKLTRPIHRFAQMEVAWRWLRRASNVELYDYDRHIVGLYWRVFSN